MDLSVSVWAAIAAVIIFLFLLAARMDRRRTGLTNQDPLANQDPAERIQEAARRARFSDGGGL